MQVEVHLFLTERESKSIQAPDNEALAKVLKEKLDKGEIEVGGDGRVSFEYSPQQAMFERIKALAYRASDRLGRVINEEANFKLDTDKSDGVGHLVAVTTWPIA